MIADFEILIYYNKTNHKEGGYTRTKTVPDA